MEHKNTLIVINVINLNSIRSNWVRYYLIKDLVTITNCACLGPIVILINKHVPLRIITRIIIILRICYYWKLDTKQKTKTILEKSLSINSLKVVLKSDPMKAIIICFPHMNIFSKKAAERICENLLFYCF